MKKRVFALISLVIIFTFCLAMVGCQKQGKSAYQVAVDNGFKGTEQEWLESLKGNDGKDANPIDFYALFEEFLYRYPGASFADFLATLSITGYTGAEYAANIGVQSALSIFSTFSAGGIFSNINDYSAAGSGVVYKIIDDDVYVITNYHVVYDKSSTTAGGIAKTITLYSYGFETQGKGVTAQFMGGSISKDIAVLKASLSNFAMSVVEARVGNSNDLSLGEQVIAIGNPSAEGISVSVGAVSIDSEVIEMEALDSKGVISMRVIRTDTAINKGNSGGGLFNSRGELVGIVNAKTIESGVENIGFAIPSNVATGIADCIIEGNAQKCFLGIATQVIKTVTQYVDGRVSIIETIMVSEVTASSLAKGKLQVNDRLLSAYINDNQMPIKITRSFTLSDYLYSVREGDTIYIRVERGEQILTVSLTPTMGDFVTL